MYPEDGNQADALFKTADMDMYRAKVASESRPQQPRYRAAVPESKPPHDASAIAVLARVAKLVSVDKKHSIRATKVADDEVEH